jgi:hypothetical protein
MKTIRNAESNESTLRLINTTTIKMDDRNISKLGKKKGFPCLTFGILKNFLYMKI